MTHVNFINTSMKSEEIALYIPIIIVIYIKITNVESLSKNIRHIPIRLPLNKAFTP
jgi:hypothetical protein